MKKIIIAGGTGFIGDELKRRFQVDGYQVLVISRNGGDLRWSDQQAIIAALEDADLLLNLAGKSVNCRFTEKNKEALMSSRIATTRQLGEALLQCRNAPALWINASGASIYPADSQRANTEKDSIAGKSFMAEVARQWEKTLFSFNTKETRLVALRTSLVLGKSGGVYPVFRKLARFGLAGTIGNGSQKMSWIHIEDYYNMILHLLKHPEISGPVNCSAPHVPDNKTFMREVRRSISFPFGIPAPEFAIRLAAPVLDLEPSLLLDSMWVSPKVLLETGFQFKYVQLNDALRNLNNP
jgi:uncharacterized protein (TIGR01777 family)